LLTRAEKARATFFEKRDIFFLHNLKFTRIIVSELADLLPFTYNNFIDLESVGNQGTQKAIERFKANRARFSTYARYWIYQSALREIQRTGRGIRLPVSIQKKIRSLRRIIAGLQEEEGDDYEPNVNELAALTDVPKQIITSYLQKDFETVSIHAPLGDDGDEIAAFVEDVTQLPAYEDVHRKGYKIAIEELLASLTLREASVLRERYGLNEDGVPKTLEQVGKEKRITRERIRQIQKKALNKLRLRIERKEYEFTGQGSRISREDMV
jgi:RNA polymerase primary sigma factor